MTESLFIDLLVKISIIQIVFLSILTIIKKAESSFRYQLLRVALMMILILPLFSLMTINNSYVLFEIEAAEFVVQAENQEVNGATIAPINLSKQSNRFVDKDNDDFAKLEKREEQSNLENMIITMLKILYLFVIIIFFIRFIVGSYQLKKLKHKLISNMKLKQIRQKLNINRPIELYQSNQSISPMTWGILKPKITIPKDAALWDEEMLKLTLLHESIHIKRFDYAYNLLSYAVLMLLCFSPISYLFYSRFRIEQEASCDELVLKNHNSQLNYANHLVQIARMLVVKRDFLQTGVNMMNKKQLTQRVIEIFEEKKILSKKKQSLITFSLSTVLLISAMSFKTLEISESNKNSVKDPIAINNNRDLHENRNDYQKQESEFTPTEYPFARVKHNYTAKFGKKINPFGKEYIHKGLDIACAEGTDVYATASGIVEFSGEKGHWGLRIDIKHSNEHGRYDFETRYSHMSEILVKEGQRVKKGDLIGKVGNTGKSTNPHLHYEVHYKNEAVDPMDYFPIVRKKVEVNVKEQKLTRIIVDQKQLKEEKEKLNKKREQQ